MSDTTLENTPLDEVALSVDFRLSDFSSVYLGLYWDKIRERFPRIESERVPYLTAEDEAESAAVLPETDRSPLPPLRRVVFESEDAGMTLELQRGRFSYSWRRQKAALMYPRFAQIFQRFQFEWNTFASWCSEQSGVSPEPLRLDLSYVNRFDASRSWNARDSLNILSPIAKEWTYDRPLIGLALTVRVKIDAVGDLYMIHRPKHGSQGGPDEGVSLEFRVRTDEPKANINDWFESAHEEIGRAFSHFIAKAQRVKWSSSGLETGVE